MLVSRDEVREEIVNCHRRLGFRKAPYALFVYGDTVAEQMNYISITIVVLQFKYVACN